MYDLVIKNGSIIDGTASPSYKTDVAIKDGKIVKVAKGIQGGKKIIDATGLTVTPGFIDSHSHSDKKFLTFPDQKEKIEQGITTSIAGQCGDSVAPISRDVAPEAARQIADFGKETVIYKTMGTFLNVAKNVRATLKSYTCHNTCNSHICKGVVVSLNENTDSSGNTCAYDVYGVDIGIGRTVVCTPLDVKTYHSVLDRCVVNAGLTTVVYRDTVSLAVTINDTTLKTVVASV